MPGIQLIQSKKSKISLDKSVLKKIEYFSDYQQVQIFQDSVFEIYKSAYPDYPIWQKEDEKFLVIIEGYLYNKNHAQFIEKIIDLYNDNKLAEPAELSALLKDIDGDYIMYFIDKEYERLIIFNDQLKRLPLYFYQSEDFFICARDLKFITEQVHTEIEPKALIDYLLFMVPAQDLTLYRNIKKLDCANLIVSDPGMFTKKVYHIWDYQAHNLLKQKFSNNVEEISNILSKGMKHRTEKIIGQQINVLLSGGLDSRTVIALLERLDKPVTGRTFIYPDESNLSDYQKSQEIAEMGNFAWQGYKVDEINQQNIREIIELKDAMNFAGIANMLDFLTEIKKPQQQYFTGDLGRILKNDFPREKIGDQDSLIKYILKYKAVFSPQQISSLLEIPLQQIYDRISEILSAYPETEMKYKYLHFIYHERTLNWLQEGEDRNRKFFWSATPFSNQLLYSYVKNIEPKQKYSFKLYLAIIRKISAKYLKIEYNQIMRIDSLTYQFTDRCKMLLGQFPLIKNKLKAGRDHNKRSFDAEAINWLLPPASVDNQQIFHNLAKLNYSASQLYTLVGLMEYFGE